MNINNPYPKAFNLNMSNPRMNEANMIVVDLSVDFTKNFEKYMRLMQHRKFRIAKKNAKKLAELLDAKFYKDKSGKWVVGVGEK